MPSGKDLLGIAITWERMIIIKSDDVLKYLNEHQIDYQLVQHPAVYTAEEADHYTANYDFARAKNLFLHDKHSLYLVMVQDNKRVDMKKLRQVANTGRLSFAKEQQLVDILGVSSGSVSPFNLLNDHSHQVKVIFDQDLADKSQLIGCHPNTNTTTVILKISDLLNLIKTWGNSLQIVDL